MAEKHRVKEDTTVTLEDGRQIQYTGGTEISMAEAVSAGLVKEPKKAGPSETKDEEPEEARAATTTTRATSKKK